MIEIVRGALHYQHSDMRSGVGVGPVEKSLGDARKSDEFRLALGSGRVGLKDKHDRYYRGNAGSQMKSSVGL